MSIELVMPSNHLLWLSRLRGSNIGRLCLLVLSEEGRTLSLTLISHLDPLRDSEPQGVTATLGGIAGWIEV